MNLEVDSSMFREAFSDHTHPEVLKEIGSIPGTRKWHEDAFCFLMGQCYFTSHCCGDLDVHLCFGSYYNFLNDPFLQHKFYRRGETNDVITYESFNLKDRYFV